LQRAGAAMMWRGTGSAGLRSTTAHAILPEKRASRAAGGHQWVA
jgi:hypothetical protein